MGSNAPEPHLGTVTEQLPQSTLLMEANLRKRVASAAVLIPAVTLAVLALPTSRFALLLMALAAGGAWEWAGLSGWPSRAARLIYTLAVVLGLWLFHSTFDAGHGGIVLTVAGAVWWCVALAWVIRYQRGFDARALEHALARAVTGLLVIAPAWAGLVVVHGAGPHGRWWVMYLLVLIWIADAGAYFAGRRWGRRPLAARVSPGKTWEGVAGGLIAVVVLAVVTGVAAGQPRGTLWLFVGLCVGTALISVLGDLTESMFKRRAGVKDSGRLIPGHGGVLDRIDSLCAAAPVFALGMVWLEIVA